MTRSSLYPVADLPKLPVALERLFAMGRRETLLFGALSLILVFVLDVLTPAHVNVSFLYVVILFLVSWNAGWRAGLAFVALAIAMQCAAISRGLPLAMFAVIVFNRLGIFLVVVALTAISRQLYDRASAEANIDPLTGLPNRRWFEKILQRQMLRNRQFGEMFSVVFIDCDRLKDVNQSQGRAAGDALLHLVGKTLERTVEHGDVVARLGGDEFAVLLHGVVGDAAHHATTRIKRSLDASVREFECPLTFSLGLAYVDDKSGEAEGIVERCNRLMDAAKLDGGNSMAHGGGMKDANWQSTPA